MLDTSMLACCLLPRHWRTSASWVGKGILYKVKTHMRYQVLLKKTDEGYAVWCPGLPGCWSQGATEEEALQNIRDAIQDYLKAVHQLHGESDEVREVEVPVGYA